MVQKELERLRQPIRDGLQCRSRGVLARRTRKGFIEIVFIGKRLIALVLLLRVVQHGSVRLPCFNQTLLQAKLLAFRWVQLILKRSHTM